MVCRKPPIQLFHNRGVARGHLRVASVERWRIGGARQCPGRACIEEGPDPCETRHGVLGDRGRPPHAHVDRPHDPGGEIELIQHDVAVPRVVVPCLIALEAVQWEPRLVVVLAIACGVPSTRPGARPGAHPGVPGGIPGGGPGVEVVDGGGEGARAAHEPHWVEAGDVERRSPGGAEVPERVN